MDKYDFLLYYVLNKEDVFCGDREVMAAAVYRPLNNEI